MDICCLQETKCHEINVRSSTGLLITLPTSSPHYGLGFIVSRKWTNNILHVESLSDRLAVINLQFTNYKRKNSKLTIINANGTNFKKSSGSPRRSRTVLSGPQKPIQSSQLKFVTGNLRWFQLETRETTIFRWAISGSFWQRKSQQQWSVTGRIYDHEWFIRHKHQL